MYKKNEKYFVKFLIFYILGKKEILLEKLLDVLINWNLSFKICLYYILNSYIRGFKIKYM